MTKASKNITKIGLRKYWFGLIFSRAVHDIWEYIKGHLAMALLIILAAIVTSILSANGVLDAAIFNGYISDANSLIRAFAALLVLSFFYLAWSLFYYPVKIHNESQEKIGELEKSSLEIIPVNNIDTHIKYRSFQGWSWTVGVKVHNENTYDINECFGTLETLQRVYIERGILVYGGHWLFNMGLDVSKKLRWTSGEDTTCKISIPAKSKETVLMVSSIIHVAEVEKNGKAIKVKDRKMKKYVIFNFCETYPKTFHGSGLFKVKIRINGKVFGKADIIEYFEGYVYSYMTEDEHNIYWSKDPLQNQSILKDPRVLRG